jgi:hypothetical protein
MQAMKICLKNSRPKKSQSQKFPARKVLKQKKSGPEILNRRNFPALKVRAAKKSRPNGFGGRTAPYHGFLWRPLISLRTQTSFGEMPITTSPTVAQIRACSFPRVSRRCTALIREKAALLFYEIRNTPSVWLESAYGGLQKIIKQHLLEPRTQAGSGCTMPEEKEGLFLGSDRGFSPTGTDADCADAGMRMGRSGGYEGGYEM